MKFELKPNNRGVSDEELLDDLKRIAQILKKNSIGVLEYNERGRFSSRTISGRFNGWNNAIEKAGLNRTTQQYPTRIPEKKLFENIEEIWIKLGRQPFRSDMLRPVSKYSYGTYEKRFGTWRKALEAFIEYMNIDIIQNNETKNIVNKPEPIQVIKVKTNKSKSLQEKENPLKHKTKRDPSSRLKVQVLMRDGNTCRLCGITVTGENIHFDHIKPWSKGGETTLENLQVLCAEHNIAKSNLEY